MLKLILVLSLLIRIVRLDYPLSFGFAWGDGTRDFLVASHIVKYGEFPLLGPANLLADGGIKNSPIYFYLLSIPLFLFNNILTISFINIILQTFTIFLLYLIVKKIFDQKTAIICSLLYSFNWEVLHQSDFIWQPNLMLPIIGLSILFESGLLLALSFALHNSAFPWIPPFLILLSRRSTDSLVMFFLALFLFYLPTFKYFEVGSLTLSSQYFDNLISNINLILSALNLNNPIYLIMLLIFAAYYITLKDRKIKTSIFIIILAILPIISASFFHKIRTHYLILSIPAIVLIISRMIAVLKNQAWVRMLTLISFVIISSNFKFLTNTSTPFANQRMINNISEEIIQEIKDPNSFQIKSYALDTSVFDYPVLDTIFIVSLEEKLNQKLAKVSDQSFFNHIQTGRKDYILVYCHQFSGKFTNDDCLKEFLKQHPYHVILKNLYNGNPFSVYLSKKND